MIKDAKWLKDFLCLIGIHDWEYLESKSEAAVRTEIETEGRVTCHDGGPRVVKKVCLDCGQIVDTFTPYVKQVKSDIKRAKMRRARALVMTNSVKLEPGEKIVMGVDFAEAMKELPDGVPCAHRGCLSHVTHPCEVCGRVAGRRVVDG